ncbi:transcription termination/antitermination protein NusG [Enterovibrio norvegicus]|uniref:NusG-like N-terminal domain-containing protein n=1 Tax=Enterovibrio norvegicus TaxID=188144 RepID=A0A2N7L7D8_9GAMM|nr:transcription termination/antitermination NusG family protein [Enterovibrio norvegicus]PML79168.1 hypothetical protein BCT69_14370 [Enterovibrio norvegicus]PMN72429.1 hypothetical protein BCT27_13560 [Enterovibrio norvegicus]PMN89915.1 hypothetical protein BCT23_21695 [Enterovibrio norvegicus]
MHSYRWYVAFTHVGEEQDFVDRLQRKGMDVYLPVRTFSQVLNGKRRTSYEPLFKCHVFVRTTPEGLQWVKTAPELSHFVRHGKYLASVPGCDIVKIKTVLHYYEQTESINNNKVDGCTIAVINGSLKGITGKFVEMGEVKLIATPVTQLGFSMLLDLPSSCYVRTEISEFTW